MKRKLSCAVLTLTFVLGCSVIALAQGAHVLQGKVISPNGGPPPNAVRVKLTFNGRAIYEAFSDLSGRFSFPGLSRGTYQLTAEGDGRTFETTTVYAEVSAFGNAPQSFTQDVQLRPIAHKPTNQPGVVNAFSQVVPEAAQTAFELGMKLAGEGKINAGIDNLKRAIQIFPDFFEAHLELGNIFLKTERFNESIAELDLARQINPNDERAYQSFGLLLLKQKNYQVAVAIFAEATRLNPQNPINAVMRATALIHQAANTSEAQAQTSLLNRAELAVTEASELSGNKMKPDSLTLALFYEMKGEPNRAADELDAYLRKTSTAKNSPALENEIKRLREKARATKSTP
jgi:tetratricopeptide (TPR) repeat protein